MPDKQSRELYLFERFLPELFNETSYTLSQPSPPLPDVIVQIDERKIGIEMTALILNEEIRQREATQDAILNEAQKTFEERYQMPLHVEVSFAESACWKKLKRQQVAIFLSDTVGKYVTEVKDLPQNQDQFDIRINNLGHEYIRSVRIFYLDRLTIPCWSLRTSFWVPSISIEIIQEIIRRKDKNISGYLTGCDEVWLLMLETGSQSSYFDQFEHLQKVTFTSGFTRILIGRISKGELLELQIKS